jgi:transcriptional regulator with XRE-family HTH domain
MADRRKRVWAALVPIDRARVSALLARRGLSASEVARRVGMSPQKLNHVLTGRVSKARLDERRRLARVLGASIAFLSGDKNAPPPGVAQSLLGPMLDDVLRSGLSISNADSVGSRAEAETVVLLGELDRVFPSWTPVSDEDAAAFAADILRLGTSPTTKRSLKLKGKRWTPPSLNRINGARLIFHVEALHHLLALGEPPSKPSESEIDSFAADMARVIEAVFKPWASDSALEPPKGARIAALLANVATGLALSALDPETRETTAFAETLAALDGVVEALSRLNYHDAEARLIGTAPALAKP